MDENCPVIGLAVLIQPGGNLRICGRCFSPLQCAAGWIFDHSGPHRLGGVHAPLNAVCIYVQSQLDALGIYVK